MGCGLVQASHSASVMSVPNVAFAHHNYPTKVGAFYDFGYQQPKLDPSLRSYFSCLASGEVLLLEAASEWPLWGLSGLTAHGPLKRLVMRLFRHHQEADPVRELDWRETPCSQRSARSLRTGRR